MSAGSVPAVSRWVLWRVFVRSFFLQASWNREGMQNLGMAYALFPALESLYPEPAKLSEAVRRHLAFFNTHPYVAAAIVGGVIRHEERIARGEEPPSAVENFKTALMGPLAALGDGFFWLSLRPAAGALSVAMVPLLHTASALVFLVFYNLVHLYLRAQLFWLGLERGDALVEDLARQNLPAQGAKLRAVAAVCAGGVAAWLAWRFGMQVSGRLAPALAGGCLVLGVLSYVVVVRKATGYALFYVGALSAVLAGALL